MKGRRRKPLLRLGSYKPMTFRSWVVDSSYTEYAKFVQKLEKNLKNKKEFETVSKLYHEMKQKYESEIFKINIELSDVVPECGH